MPDVSRGVRPPASEKVMEDEYGGIVCIAQSRIQSACPVNFGLVYR